jgi:hypothetical protein
MRKSLLLFLCCALFPMSAWSALSIGDFTLGMPRAQVMEILHRYFPRVEQEHNHLYPVPMPYYRALEPTKPYLLGDVPIYVVEVYFDDTDRLKQLNIAFDITDPECLKPLIPLMREARPIPGGTNDRHEVMLDDGELTYDVSKVWDWTTVGIADKAASKVNIPMRAHLDQVMKASK